MIHCIWRNYIPDELQSALAAARELQRVVSRTSHPIIKLLVSTALPFAAGCGVHLMLNPTLQGDFYSTAITVLGILSGFLMSLMLFSGRLSGAESLNYESSQLYRNKILYLLWSQTITLVIYILTAFLCMLWFAVAKEYQPVVSVLVSGGLATSMVRSLLLPYQLVDMHKFSLDILVKSKLRERKEAIARAKQELHNSTDPSD